MKNSPQTDHLDVRTGDKFRAANQRSGMLNAIVVEVFFDSVSIQLNGDGALMRKLKLTGGPVKAGDSVQVDFTTSPPQVIAKGATFLTEEDLEKALAKLFQERITQPTKIMVTLFSGGQMIRMYTPSAEGIASALNDATAGDIVWLPDITVSTNITVPDHVALVGISNRQSIIRGVVTLGESSSLENLKVVSTSNDDDVEAVVVIATELPAHISGCEIHAYQCVAGNAVGIRMDDSSLLKIHGSLVVGHAAAGNAYAVEFTAGSHMDALYTQFWASTNWFTGTGSVNEYANTEGFEESELWCAPPGTDYFPFFTGYGVSYGSGTPMIGELKHGGFGLESPTADKIVTGTSFSAGANFTRRGDYIYFELNVSSSTKWIREWCISEGTSIDLQITGNFSTSGSSVRRYGGYVVMDDRKVLATATSSFNSGTGDDTQAAFLYNYILDFSDSSVTEEELFEQEDPSNLVGFPPAVTVYDRYLLGKPIVTKNSSGDIIIAITGPYRLQTYDGDIFSYYYQSGRYVFTKNWTQSGSWVITSRELAFPLETDFFYEVRLTPAIPVMVSTRYMVIQESYSRIYETHSETTPYTDGRWIGFWVFDFDTGSLEYVYEFFNDSSIWASYSFFGSYGVDHNTKSVFMTLVPGNGGADYAHRLWKMDAINKTISIELVASDPDHSMYVFSNNSICLVLEANDDAGTNYTVSHCETLEELNPSLDGDLVSGTNDYILDDDNGFFWKGNTVDDLIEGWDPLTGEGISFAAGIDTGSSALVWCFGDVFLSFQTGGTNAGWKIFRS